VPEDASLIAFNDHPLAGHMAPPLTTVRMPNLRMGAEAVRLLLRAVAGETISDVVIDDPPELVIRASTAPPPS
jgi:LacI family transcriptional regulator